MSPEMMRHENQPGSLLREPSQRFPQFALRRKIQSIGRLIEQQLAGTMHQSPRNQDAPLLSCGHLADQLICQVRSLDSLQRFHGALAHLIGHMQIRPQRGCRKESGNHRVQSGGHRGTLAGQFRAHQARRRQCRSACAVAVRSQRSRPKMRTRIPGCTMG